MNNLNPKGKLVIALGKFIEGIAQTLNHLAQEGQSHGSAAVNLLESTATLTTELNKVMESWQKADDLSMTTPPYKVTNGKRKSAPPTKALVKTSISKPKRKSRRPKVIAITGESIKTFRMGPPTITLANLATQLGMQNPKTSGVKQVSDFIKTGVTKGSKYYSRFNKLMALRAAKNQSTLNALKLTPVEDVFRQKVEEVQTRAERQLLGRALGILQDNKQSPRVTNAYDFYLLDLKNVASLKGVGQGTIDTLKRVQDEYKLDTKAMFV